MPADRQFRGLSLPSSLMLARPPRFTVFDENGVPLDLGEHFDPRIDPMAYVALRNAPALMSWGEHHARAITLDESIPLGDRLFFVHRGLAMEADRLYRHRARFARWSQLQTVIEAAAGFLALHPSTYSVAFSMMSTSYNPVIHAVGTGLLSAALSDLGSVSGDTAHPDALARAIFAGMVADVGLVDLERDLLSFDNALTPPEREVLHSHPLWSARIVEHAGITDQALISAVAHHHERIDGSGYALRLAGTAVPRLAQCVGLADSFLSLTTSRPKRTAMSPDAALQLVAGGGFDDDLVAALDELVAAVDPAEQLQIAVA